MVIYLAKMAKIHNILFSQFIVRLAKGYMANTNGNPVRPKPKLRNNKTIRNVGM